MSWGDLGTPKKPQKGSLCKFSPSTKTCLRNDRQKKLENQITAQQK